MTLFLTRTSMRERLGQAFPPEQADALVDILDEIRQIEVRHAADTQDLKQGLRELTTEVRNLVDAQQRTDERLAKFEERTEQRFQRSDARMTKFEERLIKFEERTEQRFQHTDERLAELTTAQKHTDERLAELAAAQQRTDESLAKLSQIVQVGFTDLRQAVGALANRFGFDLEEFVAALLPPYIEKHAGITGLMLERGYFEMTDNQHEEVDLVGRGQQAGQSVTVLAECRTTIGGSEMRRLAAKLERVAATLSGNVLKIVVAMNLHPTGKEAAQETGIWAIPYSRINRERE